MMELDGLTACAKLIRALEDGHANTQETLKAKIDESAYSPLKKRFVLIGLLIATTSILFSALNITSLFDHDYDEEIIFANIGGSVFLLLMAFMGYLTLRNINDKLIGLDKRQKKDIHTYGYQAKELAKLLKTEAVLNNNFNSHTETVLRESSSTLTGYSNTPNALNALNRINVAAQHAKFLISNPTITPSDLACDDLQLALFQMFKTTHQVKAEIHWQQLKFNTLFAISVLLILGAPTSLCIASSFENSTEKYISIGAGVTCFILGSLLQYFMTKMNANIKPELNIQFFTHKDILMGSLLKYFPENQIDNSDHQLISLILDELNNQFRKCRTLSDSRTQISYVSHALQQTLIFAEAKFKLFRLPDKITAISERTPLLV